MVAANKNRAKLAYAFRHFIGIGAIADDIAKIEDTIMRWRRLQAGLQGFQIRMNVRNDEYAHANP